VAQSRGNTKVSTRTEPSRAACGGLRDRLPVRGAFIESVCVCTSVPPCPGDNIDLIQHTNTKYIVQYVGMSTLPKSQHRKCVLPVDKLLAKATQVCALRLHLGATASAARARTCEMEILLLVLLRANGKKRQLMTGPQKSNDVASGKTPAIDN
jgi:hypothetical protein